MVAAMTGAAALIASIRADFLRRLRAFARSRDLAPSRLAAMAELHPNTLRDIWSDEWKPSDATMAKLEELMARETELGLRKRPSGGSEGTEAAA